MSLESNSIPYLKMAYEIIVTTIATNYMTDTEHYTEIPGVSNRDLQNLNIFQDFLKTRIAAAERVQNILTGNNSIVHCKISKKFKKIMEGPLTLPTRHSLLSSTPLIISFFQTDSCGISFEGEDVAEELLAAVLTQDDTKISINLLVADFDLEDQEDLDEESFFFLPPIEIYDVSTPVDKNRIYLHIDAEGNYLNIPPIPKTKIVTKEDLSHGDILTAIEFLPAIIGALQLIKPSYIFPAEPFPADEETIYDMAVQVAANRLLEDIAPDGVDVFFDENYEAAIGVPLGNDPAEWLMSEIEMYAKDVTKVTITAVVDQQREVEELMLYLVGTELYWDKGSKETINRVLGRATTGGVVVRTTETDNPVEELHGYAWIKAKGDKYKWQKQTPEELEEAFTTDPGNVVFL